MRVRKGDVFLHVDWDFISQTLDPAVYGSKCGYFDKDMKWEVVERISAVEWKCAGVRENVRTPKRRVKKVRGVPVVFGYTGNCGPSAVRYFNLALPEFKRVKQGSGPVLRVFLPWWQRAQQRVDAVAPVKKTRGWKDAARALAHDALWPDVLDVDAVPGAVYAVTESDVSDKTAKPVPVPLRINSLPVAEHAQRVRRAERKLAHMLGKGDVYTTSEYDHRWRVADKIIVLDARRLLIRFTPVHGVRPVRCVEVVSSDSAILVDDARTKSASRSGTRLGPGNRSTRVRR